MPASMLWRWNPQPRGTDAVVKCKKAEGASLSRRYALVFEVP